MEDGDWSSADEYCEKVLDLDPECAQAYLGKLMAELHIRRQEALANQKQPFDKSNNYQKVMRFGDEALRGTLEGYIAHIRQRNEEARLNGLYDDARRRMDAADSETVYKQAGEIFSKIPSYRDADELRRQCLEQAEVCRKEAIYNGAVDIMTQETPNALRKAAKQLAEIPGWRDADQLRAYCLTQADELKAEAQRRAEEERLAAEKRAEEERIAAEKRAEEERLAAEQKAKEDAAEKERKKKAAVKRAVIALLAVILAVAAILVVRHINASAAYNKAEAYLADGDVAHAIGCFRKAGNYKDAKTQSVPLIKTLSGSIAASWECVMGVERDGTVVVAESKGEKGNVSGWRDIVAVATGYYHSIGLKEDGTVVATGGNECGACNVSRWTDIVAISAGGTYSVGLKADGTVVTAGWNYGNVSQWADIIAVAAGSEHMLGLKADGTVLASGNNEYGQCDVSGWTDIVAVAAGYYYSIGLKSDGTVVTTGDNKHGQRDVSGWTDIVAVAAGGWHSLGLKADGSAVIAGLYADEQCGVSEWTDVVAVAAGWLYTLGLKADGTVVATGNDGYWQRAVSGWTDIGIPMR